VLTVGSNTREVVFGLAGITILAVAVWVMFNQADPSRGNEAASEPTQVADTADQLPTRITLPSDVDGETIPSPSPTAAPTPTNTPIPDFHVVEEGETLTTIGAIYGVDPDDIAAKNDISDPNKILVGQQLLLPVPGEDLPDRQTGQIDSETYIVQEGDTLFGLSREFGVSIEALMETNNIENQNKLFVGLRLTIPEQVVPQP
jgi:LysM repeat protein